ncbi:MAG: hypothetical protein ACREBR_03440 [bacterium]
MEQNRSTREFRGVTDELGKLAHQAALHLTRIGWQGLCSAHRGTSCLHPSIGNMPHKAARLLHHLQRRGASVRMRTAPWSLAQKDAAMQYGSHASATGEFAEFLCGEMTDMVNKGYWMVLPYASVRELQRLRLSPAGVVPQRERRPRTIIDYTWSGVNAETMSLAPKESMQFGRALQRMLQKIHGADTRRGPVHLMKLDLSDGFYRVDLNADDVLALGVALPKLNDEEPLVAFPLVLPMGWLDSPPYFSAVTETIADVTNMRLRQGISPPTHHRHDAISNTKPQPCEEKNRDVTRYSQTMAMAPPPVHRSFGPLQQPLEEFDVYLDDFLGLAQGPVARRDEVRRLLYSTVDEAIRPLHPSDRTERKDPFSLKKLLQGDGAWTTRKVVLGWVLDTVEGTISLPPHRVDRLRTILNSILPAQKRTSRRKWQKILGELRSMVLAVPGGHGLFSHLQAALRSKGRVSLSKPLHDEIVDWRWLVGDLADRPTRIAETILTPPLYVGACDASAAGMGGVWLPPTKMHLTQDLPTVSSASATTASSAVGAPPPPLGGRGSPPSVYKRTRGHPATLALRDPPSPALLWRFRFPPSVSTDVVSYDNPKGGLTNSDLELAGVIGHQDILAQEKDIRERTNATLCDNTPAVAWARRGSTSHTGPVAYLLRLLSLHQRFHRYRVEISHIPGTANAMADDCSRLWRMCDSDLLSYFDTHYPQSSPWQMRQMRQGMASALTSALWQKRQPPESFLNAPKHVATCGTAGQNFVWNSTWTPSWPKCKIPSRLYKSSLGDIVTAASPPAATRYALEQWRMPSARWDRRSPGWGPRTLV